MVHAPLFLLLFGENPGKRGLISRETDFSDLSSSQTLVDLAFPLRPLISLDYFAGLSTGKNLKNWSKTSQSGVNDRAAQANQTLDKVPL